MTAADSTSETSTSDAPIEATVYELIGGEPVVRRLADRFYEIMDSDPGASGIRAMHEFRFGGMPWSLKFSHERDHGKTS